MLLQVGSVWSVRCDCWALPVVCVVTSVGEQMGPRIDPQLGAATGIWDSHPQLTLPSLALAQLVSTT